MGRFPLLFLCPEVDPKLDQSSRGHEKLLVSQHSALSFTRAGALQLSTDVQHDWHDDGAMAQDRDRDGGGELCGDGGHGVV